MGVWDQYSITSNLKKNSIESSALDGMQGRALTLARDTVQSNLCKSSSLEHHRAPILARF
jgi:hypothetical protein